MISPNDWLRTSTVYPATYNAISSCLPSMCLLKHFRYAHWQREPMPSPSTWCRNSQIQPILPAAHDHLFSPYTCYSLEIINQRQPRLSRNAYLGFRQLRLIKAIASHPSRLGGGWSHAVPPSCEAIFICQLSIISRRIPLRKSTEKRAGTILLVRERANVCHMGSSFQWLGLTLLIRCETEGVYLNAPGHPRSSRNS